MPAGDYRGVRRQSSLKKRGTYSRTRQIWVDLGRLDIAFHISPEDPENPDDLIDGIEPSTMITLRGVNIRDSVSLNLTMMTEEELLAVKRLFMEAFDDALPRVRRLDQHAKEMAENGDDSYSRLYRQVPVYVDRRGQESEHGEGVPERPATDPVGDAG